MAKKSSVDFSIFEKGSNEPDEEERIFAALRAGAISSDDAREALNTLLKHQSGLQAFKRIANVRGPEIHVPEIPKIQMEKVTEYASAKVLLKSLNRYYADWSKTIEKDYQVVIYVILANGEPIRVNSLIEEGYNGIAIEGEMNGAPCLVLLQQSSLQFVCIAEKLEPSQPRRNIGFIFAKPK